MKFARFFLKSDQRVRTGVVTDKGLKEIKGTILGEWDYTGKFFDHENVVYTTPLRPNQVIGIGANYVAEECEKPETLPEVPVFFFKPTSSVIGPEEAIIIPEAVEEVKFESELAVVIGREARNISESEVVDYIFGFTVANDVTAPQYFHEDGHWTIGKAFDTFTPLGPVIETDLDMLNVRVESSLNGIKKQDSPTKLMIISTQKMISYLSRVMTLKPGDVILTGSPVGAEFLKDGDVIECHIKDIGILKNEVVKAASKKESVISSK